MLMVVPREPVFEGTEDLRLMQLAGASDARAQRVLAHRLAGRVRRVAQRLLQNSTEADDASQTALIEILKSASSFNGDSSIERWADRIAVRTAIRHAREQRRRPSHGSAYFVDAETAASPVRESSVSERVARGLEEYLATLSSQRREVLVLKHALGYTVDEIAEITGAPVGTVKDRLIAARRQIRKLIQRDIAIGARSGEEKP
jgi:RNA polymerase sigma-70 factor (ECF subfamily)